MEECDDICQIDHLRDDFKIEKFLKEIDRKQDYISHSCGNNIRGKLLLIGDGASYPSVAFCRKPIKIPM